MITDPMGVFAYLAGLIALVFWLSELPRTRKLFDVVPPILFAYFLPTLSTTLGIIPSASPAYDWMTRYLLPLALLLLMIAVDVPAILRLGGMSLAMLCTGTIGIVVGAPIAYLLFRGALPPDAWQGLAALSGSWIGGSANMIAIAESVGADAAALGPIIVVDTVVGYGWMALLLFLSTWQIRFDRRVGARVAALEEASRRLEQLSAERTPLDTRLAITIIGFGFAASIAAVAVAGRLPPLGDPTIISTSTWAVLIVVTGGLLLSFTPVRRLEAAGASRLGYAALYLMITAIGARADLRAVIEAPLYLAVGAVWLAIHVLIMFAVARLLRAPLFFVATGSMANVGGVASAPVVAAVYQPALSSIGVLLAVGGYVLGIYGGLACAWLLSRLAPI